MLPIKISCVSYLNSKPFIYGIENSELFMKGEIELSLDIPKRCAEKLFSNEADIGLVPVASLPSFANYDIISKYCIGTENKVNSVNLYSQVPLEKIDKILLDYQSLTSINLLKILCKYFWKINPTFVEADTDYIQNIQKDTAGVVIGDRTFKMDNNYKLVFDLAEMWRKFTGLPFVFAVWISNKKMDDLFLQKFENSLQYGIDKIDWVIDSYKAHYFPYDIEKYLKHFLHYHFDISKEKALKLYLYYLKKLNG